jgi:hypothetical protein
VEQLDLDVAVRVRFAKEGVPLLLLVVGKREGRVALELDFAGEQKRLAGRALSLLAPVREQDPLPERGFEDRLVLADLDLDVDRLEPDRVSPARLDGALP